MAQILSDDVETQKKGFVNILAVEKDFFSYMSQEDAQQEHAELVKAYPLRCSSNHLCLPEGPLYTILRPILLFSVADRDLRVHTKFHTDIGMDTLYKFMSVGIPASEIPLTNNKTVKVKNHNQWIKNRKKFEKASKKDLDTSHWVEHPQNHDIIFRQGGHTLRQGNMDFLLLLEPYMDSYFSASSKEKKKIRETIIQGAMEKGCQFLELDRESGMWMKICDVETLHKKVTTTMYDHKKRLEHRQERQTSRSDTDKFLGGNKRRKIDDEDSICMCSFKW